MRKLSSYLIEAQVWANTPSKGDDFAIELDDGTLLETYILDQVDNNILLEADDVMIKILEDWDYLNELINENPNDSADDDVEVDMDYDAIRQQQDQEAEQDAVSRQPDASRPIDYTAPERPIYTDPKLKNLRPQVQEAEYQGRQVPLSKPMRGDVKKFKVYVRDPSTGNIKKVNFGHGGTSARRAGQKTMKIKKSDPARRRSFRARHNCDNPGSRLKARYWSCRAW